jgi:hypothetical protein
LPLDPEDWERLGELPELEREEQEEWNRNNPSIVPCGQNSNSTVIYDDIDPRLLAATTAIPLAFMIGSMSRGGGRGFYQTAYAR